MKLRETIYRSSHYLNSLNFINFLNHKRYV